MFKRAINRLLKVDPTSTLSYNELEASGVKMDTPRQPDYREKYLRHHAEQSNRGYSRPNDHRDTYVRPQHDSIMLPIETTFKTLGDAVKGYRDLISKLETYCGVQYGKTVDNTYVLIQDRFIKNGHKLETQIKIVIDFDMLCLHARGGIKNYTDGSIKKLDYYAEKDLKDMYKYLNKLDKEIRTR